MAQRALSMALVGLGCALAGTVLGWRAREWREPRAPPEAAPVEAARAAGGVYGLELLPEVLEVGLTGPWSEAPRPPPGAARLVEDPGTLREWSAGFRALNAAVERPAPLGPALAAAFLESPELFLTHYASRFDAPATKKGSNTVATLPKKGGRLMALCAGLSLTACAAVQVREAEADWLEDCPPEALAGMASVGLRPGDFFRVRLRRVRHTGTPFFIAEGPMEAGLFAGQQLLTAEAQAHAKGFEGARLYGQAKRYGDRMSVRFERLKLSTGEEVPVCGVTSDHFSQEAGLERWGPGSHWPVDVGNYPGSPRLLELEDLRPGEFAIVSTSVRVSFGAFPRGN